MLAVKGSGGDLRSITASGFAILYMDKLEALIARYRGEAHEDEMVGVLSRCAAFGENRVAASIDTPLHAFLPFDHVDHLHPDWAIALAASANGKEKLEEFNKKYGRKIVWVPWQRPGFELALMLRRAVEEQPGLRRHHPRRPRPVHLGRHAARLLPEQHPHHRPDGRVHRRARSTVRTAAVRRRGDDRRRVDRDAAAAAILPYLRGVVSSNRRTIAHWDSSDDALAFANSKWAEELCALGTSCPDHFLRTRI